MADDATDRTDLLRFQLRLTWSLAEHHLPLLTDGALLWAPVPGAATVHEGDDDRWYADWNDADPDAWPAVTAGWVSWHLGWWWSTALAHVEETPPPARNEVDWPGTAAGTVTWLTGLHDRWRDLLAGWTDADLDRPVGYPWPEPRPLARTAAWVNLELMKNVAEIGGLRLLYDATHPH